MSRATAARIPRHCAARLRDGICLIGCICLLQGASSTAQVFTVGGEAANSRMASITPTDVKLKDEPLNYHTRQDLIRVLASEQGFAMRPLPGGAKGLVLHANGPLDPSGSAYATMLQEKGMAIKPGDRVVLSDVRIEHTKIVFDLNGGPEKKHKWLSHVSIGAGGGEVPLAKDDGNAPAGSRITLEFAGGVPEMTGNQVKELISPLIDFALKTPVKAFTDTLPPLLKNAILNHEVLVGMSVEMVIYSKGQPDGKSREMDGQMPFEEWMYGQAPKDVEFVRINGNRVIRVEIAKIGESPLIFTENQVGDLVDQPPQGKVIALGDGQPTADQVAKAPPSLKKPGESLPSDQEQGAMGPVKFPNEIDKPQPIPAPPNQTDQLPPMSTTPQSYPRPH